MTKIEWTDATWNPIVGCSIASPGCSRCYAQRMAARLDAIGVAHYAGLTKVSKAGPVWTGRVALAPDDVLMKPLRWKRPRMIFVCSMGDLFHESVPDAWIDRVFAVMAVSPQHTFQVLTKRAGRMRNYVMQGDDEHGDYFERLTDAAVAMTRRPCAADVESVTWPLPNVWLGVSAERQQEIDARIPALQKTPAAIRFVSHEPLLGPVDLTEYLGCGGKPVCTICAGGSTVAHGGRPLDWIIVGGESGSGARPMHPDWARGIRDQCQAAGVAFFFKQWGTWRPLIDRDRDDPDWRADYSHDLAERSDRRWLNIDGGRGFHGTRFQVMSRVGKGAAGRLLDGRTWDEMPSARRSLEPVP